MPKGSPAHLYSWNFPLLTAALGGGVGIGAYGVFVRGTSIIWLIGGLVPFFSWAVYNHHRQPKQHLINHYEYILQKRVASVQMEANLSNWKSQSFQNTKEFATLQQNISASGKTLYQLEAQMLD